jgi:hypothetical protein
VPIRIAIAALFIAAVSLALSIPIPTQLPAVALGQVPVYRVEILLVLVYGGLLLLTPFFRGVLHGQLPIEISHRGAKWEARASEALEEADKRVEKLEKERSELMKKLDQMRPNADRADRL